MKNKQLIIIYLKKFFSIIKNKHKAFRNALNQFFYGFTVYEIELEFNKEKGKFNNLLMIMIFGDIAGLPFFPSYYSMRILPYMVPLISKWKRSIFREKDITDIITTDI